MKRILGLLLAIALMGAGPAFSDEENEVDAPHRMWLDLVGGASVVSGLTAPNLSTANRVTYLGGIGVSYGIARSIGLFIGGQATSRGIKDGSTGGQVGASFLDIPAGFIFRYRGSLLSDNGSGFFKLGGMYSQPLQGQFSGDATVAAAVGSLKTQGFGALYVESGTLFPVTDDFGLGFSFVLKYGLSEAIANSAILFNSPFDFSIGLAAAVGL